MFFLSNMEYGSVSLPIKSARHGVDILIQNFKNITINYWGILLLINMKLYRLPLPLQSRCQEGARISCSNKMAAP